MHNPRKLTCMGEVVDKVDPQSHGLLQLRTCLEDGLAHLNLMHTFINTCMRIQACLRMGLRGLQVHA